MVARPTRLIAYFDTSAFVKLVIDEPGSAAAARQWQAAELATSSLLLYPETRAALARARRMRRLTPEVYDRARHGIDDYWADVERIDLTEVIARRAAELAEEHSLRAYDAVHLASFERLDLENMALVTADADLLVAARAMGYATVPVT